MKNLVDKEQAIALKEAGYDVPCDRYMLEDGKIVERNTIWSDWIVGAAPTLDEAGNWLREAKGLHISVICIGNWYRCEIHDVPTGEILVEDTGAFETYPLALSHAITHALKMIKGL